MKSVLISKLPQKIYLVQMQMAWVEVRWREGQDSEGQLSRERYESKNHTTHSY